MKFKKPIVFIASFWLTLVFALTSVSYAQVPVNGATDVSTSTTFTVPAGLAGAPLSDGVAYDLYALNAAGNAVIGAKYDFNYSNAIGNTGPAVALINYQDYQWGVWTDGVDPTANAALYGPFAFTTIGPTITLTGGGGSIAEDGGTAALTATASAAIGKDLNVTVTYTGTVDNSVYGTDFTNSGGANPETITITAGTLSNSSTITGVADAYLEGDETVTATITSLASGVIGGSPQTVTITDAESLILSGGATISESGGAATLTATVSNSGTLKLNGGGPLAITLTYGGTATGGTDYTNSGATYPVEALSLADGGSSVSTTITGIADAVLEGDETAVATMTTGVAGLTVVGSPQTVTLTDDYLVSPINGLTGVPIEPTFTWKSNSSGYSIQVTKVSGDYTVPNMVVNLSVADGISTYQAKETDAGFPLDNGATYYWRITDGVHNSNEWSFSTIPAVTITLGNPQAGTVYTTSTMFTWAINQATGSMQFKPQVVEASSSPSEAQWAAATFTATTSNLFYTFNLNGGTQYYWRVVLLNASGEVIGYSSEITFTTSGGASVTVTPSWPVGGATVYTNTPTLYWYVNQYAPGVTYQARYSPTSSTDGSGMLDDGSATNLTTTSNLYATIGTTLSPGQTYYWQVRAYYSATTTYGTWTTPESFVTNGSGTLLTPTPSYPTGGVTVYTVSPTLYWYLSGSSDGLTFDIDYGTSVDGTADVTGVTGLYYALSGLTPGTTYQWRVRSNNGSPGTWSATETFTVSGGVTSGNAVATWPVGNPTVYTQTPTLNWYLNGSSLGLTGYKVKYSTTDPGSSAAWDVLTPGVPDATDGEAIVSGATATFWTSTANLTYGQKYYWAVASWDGSSAGTYSTGSFTVAGGSSSGSVVLSYPTGGLTINTKSPTLYWAFTGSTFGIVGYEVKYSDNGGVTSWTTVASALSSTATSVALSGLTPGATYTWKVRAYYGGSSYGTSSGTTTFVVDPGATTIVPIVGGPDNVTINSSNAEISWVIPTEPQGNLTYELVFADNEEMQNAQIITTPDVFADVNSLEANKSYYWKVRSVADDGSYSGYSNIGKFNTDDQITAIGGDAGAIPTEFKLSQNYPNPFNPSTVIEYSLPEASFVTMKIYNVLGKEIRTLVSGNQNAGNYHLEWNGLDNSGARASTGIYIYRITSGNFIATKKMLLLK